MNYTRAKTSNFRVTHVPRCKKRVWDKPATVPARGTESWCRGSWWSRRGSLLAEKTPWSQTSRTSSALLRRASPHPRTGCCPPRNGTSPQASEGQQVKDRNINSEILTFISSHHDTEESSIPIHSIPVFTVTQNTHQAVHVNNEIYLAILKYKNGKTTWDKHTV